MEDPRLPGRIEPPLPLPEIVPIDLTLPIEVCTLPRFDRPLTVNVREARLLTEPPWARSLGKLTMEVSTQGWRFPAPPEQQAPAKPRIFRPEEPPLPAPQE